MKLTLRHVLERYDRGISIPLIQRDYTYGRPGARDIRERFIDALLGALTQDDVGPLDLDFVYGTSDAGVFSPLDGQQRLTTLFLLHWYLAVRDDALDDFRRYAQSGGGARFCYRVRPSGGEFFDALVSADDVDIEALLPPDPDCANALSKTIQDRAWFYQSWRLDPTVVSCLVVLDALHERFSDQHGCYTRLVLTEPPLITFQFLNLDSFGLTDDLYIKMNARGKPLTMFETFKASLEEHVDEFQPGQTRTLGDAEVPLSRYLAQRFDTDWCDLFWALRAPHLDHDTQMMNAIRAIAVVACERTSDGERHDTISDTLDALRGAKREGIPQVRTFYDYKALNCLTPAFVDTMITLFNKWSADGGAPNTFLPDAAYYDEVAMFRHVVRGDTSGRHRVTIEAWVRFSAWCDYLLSDHPVSDLREWMRVISNLAQNTIYNRADELRSSLLASRLLLDRAGGDLIGHLAGEAADLSGFNRQQIREERLKAQLIIRDPRWRPLIERAETHAYFKGQIEFLLQFCGVLDLWLGREHCDWTDAEDDAHRAAFARWEAKASAVFRERGDDGGEPGLRDLPDVVWERALLCEGDYLLKSGSNWSFLINGGREVSWKRLLRADLTRTDAQRRRAIVGRVIEEIDPADVEGSLRARISVGVTPIEGEDFAGWRERLVEFPDLIRYCKGRQMRRVPDEAIYLLSKQRRSGKHVELFSMYLHHRLAPRVAAGALAPFDQIKCDDHWGADQHWLTLWSSGSSALGVVRIGYREGYFELKCLPELVPEDQEYEAIRIYPDDIEAVIERIAVRAAERVGRG